MLVNQIAQLVGVSDDTVRFVTKSGLLHRSLTTINRYYEYGAEDVRRLHLIRAAKSIGFTLADIRQFFAGTDRGESPCPKVRSIIEKHIVETEARLAQLNALHTKMCDALKQWQNMPDRSPDGKSVYALIEAMAKN